MINPAPAASVRWQQGDGCSPQRAGIDPVGSTDVSVSGLREAAGSDPNDPRLRAVIDELSRASDRFRELCWHRNRFDIPHSGGQRMLTYRAEPGNATAAALRALAELAPTMGGQR